MKILLDEDTPRKVKRLITGHAVRTVQEMKWSGTRNGELLRRAAAAGFEALVTFDQNMRYQQNLAQVGLPIIVFVLPNRNLPTIVPHIPELLDVLQTAAPGKVYFVPDSAVAP